MTKQERERERERESIRVCVRGKERKKEWALQRHPCIHVKMCLSSAFPLPSSDAGHLIHWTVGQMILGWCNHLSLLNAHASPRAWWPERKVCFAMVWLLLLFFFFSPTHYLACPLFMFSLHVLSCLQSHVQLGNFLFHHSPLPPLALSQMDYFSWFAAASFIFHCYIPISQDY